MKVIAAALLSLAAVVSGQTCRQCEKITAWKLYTSGSPPDWPIGNDAALYQETPGFFTRIKNGTCVRADRVDQPNWNIMMFTDPVYKGIPCCGDTDDLEKDFENLCAQFRLFKVNADSSLTPIKRSFTELYWPWFLYGDTQCTPSSFSENAAAFDVANGDCNPSEIINGAGSRTLPVGTYRLKGCTYGGADTVNNKCPDRPSGQEVPPPPTSLDCSEVTFYVKAKC